MIKHITILILTIILTNLCIAQTPSSQPVNKIKINTNHRHTYKYGVIARTDSWIDQNGQEWYLAVYDISDLTYVVPNFQAPTSMSPAELYHYQRSNFFNHTGLYYLDMYNSSVLNYQNIGPVYSKDKEQEILDLINMITTTPTAEAKVVIP